MNNTVLAMQQMAEDLQNGFDLGEDFTPTSFDDAFDMYMNDELQATLECCSYDDNYKKAVMDMRNVSLDRAVTMILMNHIIKAHATRLAEQYLEDEKP